MARLTPMKATARSRKNMAKAAKEAALPLGTQVEENCFTPEELEIIRMCELPPVNGKWPCGKCVNNPNKRGVFSRRADRNRHILTVHLGRRAFGCSKCGKSFAQKNTRDNHMNSHLPTVSERKRYICHMSKKNGTQCSKRFSDPSSLARHLKEQHKGATYQCPEPGCVDRAHKPKRIKRLSEFRKHLLQKHGISRKDLDEFLVTTWTDETPLVGSDPHKSRKRKDAKPAATPVSFEPPVYTEAPSPVSQTSPPPPYSALSYAGEIPLLRVPNDDSYASTPSMSYSSPSPAPSMPEVTYDAAWEQLVSPPSYNSLDACGNIAQDPFPQEKDMSTYAFETAAGMGLMLSDSDLNNDSYARGLNHLSYSDMLPQPDMSTLYGQTVMPYDVASQKVYPDTSSNLYGLQPVFDFTALESAGEESFAGYFDWNMPVPEHTEQLCVPQMHTIIPPSLPTFMTSQLGTIVAV